MYQKNIISEDFRIRQTKFTQEMINDLKEFHSIDTEKELEYLLEWEHKIFLEKRKLKIGKLKQIINGKQKVNK